VVGCGGGVVGVWWGVCGVCGGVWWGVWGVGCNEQSRPLLTFDIPQTALVATLDTYDFFFKYNIEAFCSVETRLPATRLADYV
jgi:hypothetical protein